NARPPWRLILFAPLLFAQTLPRKRFLCPTLLAGLHVETMLLDFLDDVFLLHLALETPQCVFQRLTFLDDDFSHLTFTPNPVRIGNLRKPGQMPVSTAISIARRRTLCRSLLSVCKQTLKAETRLPLQPGF